GSRAKIREQARAVNRLAGLRAHLVRRLGLAGAAASEDQQATAGPATRPPHRRPPRPGGRGTDRGAGTPHRRTPRDVRLCTAPAPTSPAWRHSTPHQPTHRGSSRTQTLESATNHALAFRRRTTPLSSGRRALTVQPPINRLRGGRLLEQLVRR